MMVSFEKRRGECGSVERPPNLGGAASATLIITPPPSSSLSAPRITIFSASPGNGRCNALASSHGAHPLARESLPSPNILM